MSFEKTIERGQEGQGKYMLRHAQPNRLFYFPSNFVFVINNKIDGDELFLTILLLPPALPQPLRLLCSHLPSRVLPDLN